MLINISDHRYRVTEYGENLLEKSLAHLPIPAFLNGWKYQRKANVFWERLSLSVQVISHLQNNESKYMPIQRKTETLIWIKHFLKQNKLSRENLGLQLYSELIAILESDATIEPGLLVQRLSGYRTDRSNGSTSSKNMETGSHLLSLSIFKYPSFYHGTN